MMPVYWNEHDYTPPDFDRETAMQERNHERRQQQIALRHFPVMWNRNPEANEPDPLEPSDLQNSEQQEAKVPNITDKEFLDKAHARFVEKVGLDYEQARACAEAVLGTWIENDRDGTPEAAVDDELSYWDNDE